MTSNTINLVGEFYAMSRLFLEGYEATLTLGNTKGIDILLYNPKNNKQFKVEVKTTGKKWDEKLFGGNNIGWLMDKKHELLIDESLVYCFVYIDKTNKSYRIFLVPSKDVSEYCKWEYKYWVDHAKHRKPPKEQTMRSFRIDLHKDSPYENNFSIFE